MLIVLFDGIAYGMLLFLISVGLSVTLGLMRFVNLAHGVFVMVGGYTAVFATSSLQLGWLTALLSAFIAAAVLGAVLEVLLFRPMYTARPLNQVLLSIGVVFVATALASAWLGSGIQAFHLPAWLQGQYMGLGRYRLFLVVSGTLLTLLLLLGISRTRYGAQIRASVDNPRMAAGLGIPTRKVFFLTFVLGCGLAGLGGALGLEILNMEASFALKYMVYFLMVVAVGGVGTIMGPLLAALLIGIIDTAGKYYLPELGAFLVYGLMVVVLLVRPGGLVVAKGQA